MIRILAVLSAGFVFLSFGYGPEDVYTPAVPSMPWDYRGPAIPIWDPPVEDGCYMGYKGRWVEVRATAYSPHDPIDSDYHATKGKWRWKTADGTTDVRREPYGIAVPRIDGEPWLPYGTRVVIPTGYGYVDRSRACRVFTVDDTGGRISTRTRKEGVTYVDLRWKGTADAVKWSGALGYNVVKIFVIEEE